jgi:hypothetical protein
MTFWKFLRFGAVSPFSGFQWTPGSWVSTSVTDVCHVGLHACRATDLPYWINDELWEIELAEPIAEESHKVVSSGARLIAPVEHWTVTTAEEFAYHCAFRTALHAADELREDGRLSDYADELASIQLGDDSANWPTLAVLCSEAAQKSAEAAMKINAFDAVRLCGYVCDAVDGLGIGAASSSYPDRYPVASIAYIAARTANHRSSAPGGDPYLAERRWQSHWLVQRLQLNHHLSHPR